VSLPKRRSDPTRVPLELDPARMRLSPRERETALLVAESLDDPTIARRLGIGIPLVRVYIRRIQARLKLRDRDEIVAWVAARLDPDACERRLRRLPQPR
jgi:DNA-binding CsgD family transcriptional regulator